MQPLTLLWVLLSVSALILAAWFGLEALLLRRNLRPITWYTRRLVNEHWWLAFVLSVVAALVLGIALAHFVVDSACQPAGN